ncbi:AAA family ATPase [Microbacterium sp. KR10-403]|uniref:AAA family ATPase n=1 Tax=Microbacterium sp. KR10-403 TaxID=3158581 RepID=UPI0032E5308B
MARATFDTVLINGSVGTGKTTTAEMLGGMVRQRGIPGAVIDVDWLRRSWPSPAGDPFQSTLAMENMQAITANFRRAGARLIVVAHVVESEDELERAAAALAARSMLHVRLTASPDAVLSRLTRRHDDDETALRWHAQRHPELADILDRAGFINDLRIDTTDKPVANVAQEILTTIVD